MQPGNFLLLKYALPEGAKVVAADFDHYLIEKAKLFFTNIIPIEFDFYKDDVGKLLNVMGGD